MSLLSLGREEGVRLNRLFWHVPTLEGGRLNKGHHKIVHIKLCLRFNRWTISMNDFFYPTRLLNSHRDSGVCMSVCVSERESKGERWISWPACCIAFGNLGILMNSFIPGKGSDIYISAAFIFQRHIAIGEGNEAPYVGHNFNTVALCSFFTRVFPDRGSPILCHCLPLKSKISSTDFNVY